MLKKILIAFGVVVLGLLAFIASRPSTFAIERSAVVAAPPAVAYALVADFHRWGDWSPWDKLDPNQKKTYDGPAAGVGAKTAWVGNDDVGEGRMEILGATPGQKVDIRLEFIKPFAATNQTVFSFAPEGAGTRVTWTMNGENDFMGKAFSAFMDMDKMIGKDFENGLAKMNTVAQADAKAQADADAAAAAKKAAEEAAAKLAAEAAAAEAAAAPAAAPPAAAAR